MKYYIDTSIWRDLHENREDKFRPLGEWAFEFFKRVILNKEIVLFSDLVVDELSIEYTKEEIELIFSIVSKVNLLEKVGENEDQVREAMILRKQRKVPSGDALHAILARDNGAVMVTRDGHFYELTDIAEIRKPEDLI
ncbi:PIN domain-containing protein [archaeon]|nr:PIN domain-containing protein [archaeon]